jgi:hypothetical protein
MTTGKISFGEDSGMGEDDGKSRIEYTHIIESLFSKYLT